MFHSRWDAQPLTPPRHSGSSVLESLARSTRTGCSAARVVLLVVEVRAAQAQEAPEPHQLRDRHWLGQEVGAVPLGVDLPHVQAPLGAPVLRGQHA